MYRNVNAKEVKNKRGETLIPLTATKITGGNLTNKSLPTRKERESE